MRRLLHVPVLLCLVFCALPSSARVLYVKHDAPGPARDGASWPTAYTSVTAGLAAAQPDDEIWVAGGVYTEPVTLAPGSGLYGGFRGTETTLSQRDWKANETTLDGNFLGNVVTVPPGAPLSTVVDGFTIRNGKGPVPEPGASYRVGGGLYAVNASVTVTNCLFRDNTALTVAGGGYGGGVYLRGGSAVINRSAFTGNFPAGIDGESAALDLRNNVSSGNGTGFNFSGCNLFAFSNTVTGNEGSGFALMRAASIGVIANNIVTTNGGDGVQYNAGGGPGVSLRFSNNCVHGNKGQDYDGGWEPPSTGLNGNISRDPRFSADGFHLRPDSPCVDAGSDAFAATSDTDADGQARIQGGHVDIGADEFDFSYVIPPPPPVVHVRPDGDDGRNGATWATSKRTVRAALFDVATVGGEVWVAAGVYPGAIELPDRVALYGGFAGTETFRDQRSITAIETTLDGEALAPVVTVSYGATDRTVIDGFTIRNGLANEHAERKATGVYAVGCSPVIRNNRIVGNQRIVPWGAGIWCEDGSPVVEGNTISGNPFRAIQCERTAVTITGNRITGNTTGPFFGYQTAPFTALIGAVTLVDSTANVSGNVIADNAFVLDNGDAQTGGGGGVCCIRSVAFVGGNAITGNSVRVAGEFGGTALGGGVLSSASVVRLANNLIAGNRLEALSFNVTMRGGGVYQDGGTMALVNNTIAGNVLTGQGLYSTTREGGGVYVNLSPDAGAVCSLANNIVAFNDGGLHWSGGAPSLSHNDVFGNGQDYPHVGDATGTNGNISLDPLFVDHAGSDYHLLPLSPCVDAGDDLVVSGASDQDGAFRIQGRHVDMGAYEFTIDYHRTVADAAQAMRICAGLAAADSYDRNRLDVNYPMARIDLADAGLLLRMATGLDRNP